MAKTLVAYFSAYGTTKRFAEEIHKIIGGDILEIEPETPYDNDTAHYDALAEYAKKERDNDTRPKIKNDIDISKYDTVFLGYPMWWYTFPQIIRSFLDKYDFSGKTIIPFNTHEGSGDGGTYKEMQEYVPNAKVVSNGLPIQGEKLKSDSQHETIAKWVDSLNLE